MDDARYYPSRLDAVRAARAALRADGCPEPLSGVHFHVDDWDDDTSSWRDARGELAPDPDKTYRDPHRAGEPPMTAYLVTRNAAGRVRVTTHAGQRDAFMHVNRKCMATGTYRVVTEAADLVAATPLTLGLALHLALPGDADRSDVYTALASRYEGQAREPAITPPLDEDHTMETQTADAATGKTAKAAAPTKTPKAAAKAKAPTKTARGKGKPAGKVADFTPVKDGSIRSQILRLMDGAMTAEQIGAKLGFDRAKVNAHAFCLHRDCAIGYEVAADGKLRALFPGNKTLADALKKVEPPPPKAAKPAAKAAPKAGKAKADKAPAPVAA